MKNTTEYVMRVLNALTHENDQLRRLRELELEFMAHKGNGPSAWDGVLWRARDIQADNLTEADETAKLLEKVRTLEERVAQLEDLMGQV